MRATTMTVDDDRGLWVVAFDGDMVLDRKFYRALNRWVYENGTQRRFINRHAASVSFFDETDALMCLMAYR